MLKLNSLQEGEKLSFTQYLTVVSVDKTEGSIIASKPDGGHIKFLGTEMIESMYSNSQYEKTIKAGKHELASVIQKAGDKIFTVCYTKADKSERILTGHFVAAEPNLGRTQVIDLDVDPNDKSEGLRLVDNREIKWVVLSGVRYIAQ